MYTYCRTKTPKRRRHVGQFVISLASIPVPIGIQYAILFLVFLPALGSQKMAEINAPEGKIIYSKAGFYESDIVELNAVLKGQLVALE